MSTETKFLGVILAVTLVLIFGAVFLLSPKGSSDKTPVLQIDYSKGEKIGTDSAKVKLAEFSDFQCPACAVAEPSVKKIRDNYPTQVEVFYFSFPLPQHNHGRQAAILAEAAAGQGKFWEMHDKLFETQDQWSGLPDATQFFQDLVKQLNLDENKMQRAEKDPNVISKVDQDIAEGNKIGIDATPTFFLNGRKLNLQSFDDLNTLIMQELKK